MSDDKRDNPTTETEKNESEGCDCGCGCDQAGPPKSH